MKSSLSKGTASNALALVPLKIESKETTSQTTTTTTAANKQTSNNTPAATNRIPSPPILPLVKVEQLKPKENPINNLQLVAIQQQPRQAPSIQNLSSMRTQSMSTQLLVQQKHYPSVNDLFAASQRAVFYTPPPPTPIPGQLSLLDQMSILSNSVSNNQIHLVHQNHQPDVFNSYRHHHHHHHPHYHHHNHHHRHSFHQNQLYHHQNDHSRAYYDQNWASLLWQQRYGHQYQQHHHHNQQHESNQVYRI